ncbi:protealysin inhibitor emfourin [Sphingomonas hankookensis]
MQKGKALDETVKGEVRLCIEGGLAHFPGLAKEQTVSFDDLTTPESQEIASLADQADFFSCTGSVHRTDPDIRSHDCHPRRWPSLLLRWPRDQRSH